LTLTLDTCEPDPDVVDVRHGVCRFDGRNKRRKLCIGPTAKEEEEGAEAEHEEDETQSNKLKKRSLING